MMKPTAAKARFVITRRKTTEHLDTLSGGSALTASTVAGWSGMPTTSLLIAGSFPEIATPIQDSETERTTMIGHERTTMIGHEDAATIEELRKRVPEEYILEPEIYYYSDSFDVPPGLVVRRRGQSTDEESAVVSPAQVPPPLPPIEVWVSGAGVALPRAKVSAWVRETDGTASKHDKTTDDQGRAELSLPPGKPLLAITAMPESGFWRMMATQLGSSVRIDCPALPSPGPYGWWHSKLGVSRESKGLGKGIRIGVIDTGCGPHANLGQVQRVGACLENQRLMSPAQADDVEQHGTHVCGTIAGAVAATSDIFGIAPQAEIYVMRVVSAAGAPANQTDIANAVERLVNTYDLHLINISLISTSRSELLLDEIRHAYSRGVLCVCAAGNANSDILYPARHSECVSVGALGSSGTYPAGSLSAAQIPADRTKFGHNSWFLAQFSCYGTELTVSAPGVGIIASVPVQGSLMGGYADMDGTSMAAPVVCGTLAARLAGDAAYLDLGPSSERADRAKELLKQCATDIGLTSQFQGTGMPVIKGA